MNSKKVTLPVPDVSLHPVGNASADTIGPMQLNLLVHFGLRPEGRILDLGCGVGRLAYKMADYLTSGHYYGLDISEKAITWLNKNYAILLDNFYFDLLDVNNRRYNPKGALSATEITLPYQNDFFDVVGAFSLFTHMMPPDITNYFEEIRRVLKPDGRAVLTFFCVDDLCPDPPQYETQPFLRIPTMDDAWALNLEMPERGIAFSRALIDTMVQDARLSTVEVVPGFWKIPKTKTPPFVWAHQDVFVLKPGAAS